MVDTVIKTNLETIVTDWLDRHKIDYEFQSSLTGGFYRLGDAVVSVLFPNRRLAWRIQGEYYHQQVSQQGRDLIQKELLGSLGYTTVDIWGSDIQNRLNETMRKALVGQEI